MINMKKLLLSILILLISVNVYAGDPVLGWRSEGAQGIGSHVTFFLSCDAKIDAEVASGNATVNWDAGVLINTTDQQVGAGCADQNNDSYDGFDFVIADNFKYTNSRIGFWFSPQETTDNPGYIINTGSYGATGFALKNHSVTRLELRYKGSAMRITHNLNIGEWGYIEIEFNNNTVTAYMDNISFGSLTDIDSFTDTYINFMSQDGNVLDCLIDNIIIINDHSTSLYPHRYEVYSD